MAKVTVFRVKYEVQGQRGRLWNAVVGAYSRDDLVRFLSKAAGNKHVILTEFGAIAKLDAISDAVAETIAKEVNPPKKKKKPKFVCEHCGRDDFKNEVGLKGHITRWCSVVAEKEGREVEEEPKESEGS